MQQKWVPATVLFLLLQTVYTAVEVAPKVPSSRTAVVHEDAAPHSTPLGPPPPQPDPHPSDAHPSDSHPALPHPSDSHPTLPHPSDSHPALPHPLESHPTLPHPTLPHPSIPHSSLPHPDIPHPDVHGDDAHAIQHPDPHGAPPPPTPHSDTNSAQSSGQASAQAGAQDAKAAAQKDGSQNVANKGPSADDNSLSFSSSSGNGPSSRQCSFTVSNPNTFQASSDGFGYPTFMVEGAAQNNPLAKELFKKMSQSKNAGGEHFVVPPGASGPSHTPGFAGAGRRIPGIAEIGQAVGNPSPQGLDINSMFDKIGQHANNENLGEFPHDTPSFPDHAINPGRQFGPGQLQSSFKSRDPFSGGDGGLGGVGGFGGFHFRKRRQADTTYGLGQGFKNQLETVCPFKSDYIRKFKKHNSDCYVYKPEIQGHKLATCSQEKCGHCGGSGRCVAEKQSTMMWAYCQAGPNARKLELEYVEYPAYCVCKTISC